MGIERMLDATGLPNARVLLGDATCVIRLLPDACVTTYIVQFPDPWWKRRHHRRRLFTQALVDSLVRTLLPGGTIHLVTDVEEYCEITQGLLDSHAGLHRVPIDPSWQDELTSFSLKARARNATIFASIHQRRTEGQERELTPDRHPERGNAGA
jgi:tRNA (guanine-N7-)-methyltransferase